MGKSRIVKKIARRCAVCGKKITVTVYPDRHYRNGYYFGIMELPIKGTGEYEKVRTSRLLGKNVNVVKWTGKKKEIEYWECEKCYEEAMHECWLEQKIRDLYGKKCKDYNRDCACCQAWGVYETIIDDNRGRL